jgi:Protein of unknown function (DUF938)
MTALPDLPFSPAAERNRQPILDVLKQTLPAAGAALEIASGTGQHITWFATHLPAWHWQPTDFDAQALPGIDARVARAGLVNVRPAQVLNVLSPQWPCVQGPAYEQPFDALYCANMLHIAPWSTCAGLMQGAKRHLSPQGLLITYGPYLEDDVITAEGNLAFDASLRSRHAAWGIRRREAVQAQAAAEGLYLQARHALPANNLLLVWARRP